MKKIIQIGYRLYLLIFGPFIFIFAGVIVIIQVIIHPIIWLFTGKQLTDFHPLGIIFLQKTAKPIYDFIDGFF